MYHRIVHFEIPVNDMKKGQEFYEKLFGWEFKPYGEGFAMISTGPEDKGCVGGGLAKRQKPEETCCNYILVESVADHSKKVEELGGKIVVPKRPVKGMGWFAVALDPEQNVFALWENDKNAA